MKTVIPIQRAIVPTDALCEMVDITQRVRDAVANAGVSDGMVVAFVAHTTAGITINENADPDVKCDLLRKLGKLVPRAETYYRHSEGNSDSHLKASMMGQSVTVLVENGRLQLGQWQGIYLCEFDGPRERQVLIKVVDLG